MKKIILDLCGGTGAWSRPYAEDGRFDVRIITLPRYNVFDTIIEDNAITFFDRVDGRKMTIEKSDIYGILAAPTCTMFSLARTTAKTPRDFEQGMKLVECCLRIIWAVRACKDSNLRFWALENPRAYLRQFLGLPALSFTSDEYGGDVKKPTDIWGYFKIPKKKYKNEGKPLYTKLPTIPHGYILPPDLSRAAVRRAITNSAFADAFYRANSK